MNKVLSFCIFICILLSTSPAEAQSVDTLERPSWEHDIEGWLYFFKDDFIFSPIYAVDKGWLHLEARYNYEDKKTFSAWFGYNFSGGRKFQYTLTPMLGGVVGNTNGIAPGLEIDLNFAGFELSSDSEYLFDLQNKKNDFYYNWTDLTYSPISWLWLGLSMQRTSLYDTDKELQSGVLLGGSYRWMGLSAYLYNPGTDNPYFILFLSINLPEN